MLFFKLNGHLHLLKPFILLLGFLPERVSGIGVENKTIISSDIPMDENIVKLLRKI
jgi:hypothetical protein